MGVRVGDMGKETLYLRGGLPTQVLPQNKYETG